MVNKRYARSKFLMASFRKIGIPFKEIARHAKQNPRSIYRWASGESAPDPLAMEKLEDLFEQLRSANGSNGKDVKASFTFIDLFAGIGGMRKGFESVGGHCVYTSEWNKYSQQTYAHNFPDGHLINGDITKVDEKDIPKHDVLLAGFPCQPFSIAGVSKKNALGQPHGFLCKTQGTLFYDVARIIADRKPHAFLLENVKNLASHDGGNTFRIIMETLRDKLGYKVQARIIDAKGFVPQHRERVFIVGFREDTSFDFKDLVIPKPETGPKLGSILHPEDGTEKEEPPFTLGDLAMVNPKYTLTPRLWEYLQEYAAKHKEQGNGFGFGLFDKEGVARTLSARYYKDGSEILISRGRGKRPRRLTPRECARLMGFDEPGKPSFKIVVSDTQAYRQFGNAVVVPVVKAVARHMLPHILNLKAGKKVNRPKRDLYELVEV